MIVAIRAATEGDYDFCVDTARRFATFGPPPWRSEIEVVAGEVRCLDEYFDGHTPDAALLIAEDPGGIPLGFAFLERHIDYFTQEPHAHLGMIAVTGAAEGTGAGRALMEAAESWAREQGYSMLTLNVFEGNARARALYERTGYRVETLKYVKPL